MKKPKISKEARAYLAAIGRVGGRVGGKARSRAKTTAARLNAQQTRQYTACPHPAYRRSDGRAGSHHFSPVGVCHGCKKTRDELRVRS